MQKTCFYLVGFFFLLSIGIKAQYLFQLFPDTVIKWTYDSGDEFNSPNLDESKWTSGGHYNFDQSIAFLEQNSKFKDGNVSFIADRKDTTLTLGEWDIDSAYLKKNNIPFSKDANYRFKYTCGILWSKQEYKYGYFELKFKSSYGQGIWPAFWVYGGKPNYEIDFFELKGEKEKSIHVDVHCPYKCENFKEGPLGYRKAWGHWVKTKNNLVDSFNVVSGEWNEKDIKFYLNGELIAYYNRSFDVPMNLILNTSVAKKGGAFKPGPNKDTHFPSEFIVDYVRVWKKQGKGNVSGKEAPPDGIAVTGNSKNKVIAYNRKASKKLKYYNNVKKKNDGLITVSVLPVTGKKLLITTLSAVAINAEIILVDKTNSTNQKKEALKAGETFIDLEMFTSPEVEVTIRTNKTSVTQTIKVKL